MVDLEQKFYSLKLIWIKKLLTANPETDWVKLAYSCLPIHSGHIWHCNISPKDIRKLYGSSLWLDIWHAWAKFNFSSPSITLQVLDQSISLNSFIKIRGKPILNNILLDLGVLRIQNLFDDVNRRFLTFNEFCTSTNNAYEISYLMYAAVISAIPKSWKRILREEIDPIEQAKHKNMVEHLLEMARPSSEGYKLIHFQNDKIDSVPDV